MKPNDTPEPIKPALRDFDKLPDAAQVRAPVVAALHGVSIPTVWRWARQGHLPAPSKRCGTTSWNVGELRASMVAQ